MYSPSKRRWFEAGRLAAALLLLPALTLAALPAAAQNEPPPLNSGGPAEEIEGPGGFYVSAPPTTSEAVRFLEQCTFGPTAADIDRVKSIGYDAYLNEQFAAPMSNYSYIYSTPSSIRGMQIRLLQNAVRKPDQLRQRVAFALSQVWVVNGGDNVFPGENKVTAMMDYQKILHRNAFGNYRTLMQDMTLSPTMGAYLNMVNNSKANTSINSQPNENYSRELLQLFTLGVYKLNEDGSVVLDGEGKPIETYTNAEVTAFARIFTGWTYAPQYGKAFTGYMARNFTQPMALWGPQHDLGAKTLFNGVSRPAYTGSTTGNNATLQTYANTDLTVALDNIFNHPNLPPFVATRLIQHLVTANPSPAYVNRISQVFKNNGQGVRGDMTAVVRAILTDTEARDAALARTTAGYGHWRSGILYITNILRQLEASGDLCGVENWCAELGQSPMAPPSVFSFYKPEYRITALDGQSYSAPEMQNFTTTTTIRRVNLANALGMTGTIGGTTVGGRTNVTATNITPYFNVALNTTALVDLVNERFLHNEMSAEMRTQIQNAVNAIPATAGANQTRRARTAIYLVIASQEYQVQR